MQELYWREAHEYDANKSELLRKKFLTSTLTVDQKMELYNCAVGGHIDTLKNLIENKKYPMLEECSASGYYWTVIHYAAHYGFDNIINYALQYYENNLDKKSIFGLQSNLGLSPLFICLNSSSPMEKKKLILELFIKYDALDFLICNKESEDIYDICNKKGMLDYLLSLLKED